MIVHDKLLQGSDAWFKARLRCATASEFKKIFTAKTQKLSASHMSYIYELIAEGYAPDENIEQTIHMFTGNKFIGNKYTDHGNEFEPYAREAFERETGLKCEEVGFITRNDKIIGCSPDSMIRGEGDGSILDQNNNSWIAGHEIKCNCFKTFLEIAVTRSLPDDHKAQVHGGMAVTGLSQWYFTAYFPGKKPITLLINRDEYTDNLSSILDEFLLKYAEELKKVKPLIQDDPNFSN